MQLDVASKNSSVLMLARDVYEICKPIFDKFNLNAFAYSRVFPDGSRSELWSDPAALEHTFFNKKYLSDLYTPDLYSADEKYLLLKSKIETFDSNLRKKYINQLTDQKNYFDHDHSFMIINKKNELCEYFIFYAPADNHSAINTYLNKLDSLNNFTDEFKVAGNLIIKNADMHKIILPWRNNNLKYKSFLPIQHRKSRNRPSGRELEVVGMIMQGYSAKEAAKLLNISYRTAESHISNLKLKLNCEKISELVVKLLNEDFL